MRVPRYTPLGGLGATSMLESHSPARGYTLRGTGHLGRSAEELAGRGSGASNLL